MRNRADVTKGNVVRFDSAVPHKMVITIVNEFIGELDTGD